MAEEIIVTVDDTQEEVTLVVDSGVTKTELDSLNVAYTDVDNDFSAIQTVIGVKSVENDATKVFASDGSVQSVALTDSQVYEMRCNFNNAVAEQLPLVQTAYDNATTESLMMVPSGYKAGALVSQLPKTGIGDFTVARNSIKTRVNESGIIEEIAIDKPSIDYTDGDGVLLLEPQSTNLVLWSEEFTNASWAKTRLTVTPNAIIASDSTLTADKLIDTVDNATHSINYRTPSATTINTDHYTFSVFLKKAELNFAAVRVQEGTTYSAHSTVNIDLTTGELSTVTNNGGSVGVATVEECKDGWWRLSLDVLLGGTDTRLQGVIFTSNSLGTINYTGTGVDGVYIWGAELKPDKSSYIKTEGATVTRLGDLINEAGDETTFNSEEGVLYIERNCFSDNQAPNYISISDFGTNDRVCLYFNNTKIRAFISTTAIGVQVLGDFTGVVPNQFYKAALKWKNGDCALWVDGVEISTGAFSVPEPNTLKALNFTANTSSDPMEGECKAIKVFPILTATQLTELTTDGYVTTL